ncbi:citramalate synthase [Demequina sp. TTPB684]|uniref:citramalate synthase n=1 Tax=unclassified Demequina TaxID=2620311 RepID=UPI001CF2218F|nr:MULTISPECIES: citramalate synthase [unclassified Demequina]MCB2412507.1 citramalate synthase [Demequina sp. TTPB684]UPU88790.1 citramalate synthase [Demequina sp. TMPB413]
MADLTVEIYDTTLRDGAQQEGMNLSVADKMAIAALLDELGVGVIEGGWPGAVPKDTEFFGLVHKELSFTHAQFAAFGMTRRGDATANNDPQVRALLDSEAPIITLVAKSDIRHAERALRVSGDENLRMIEETVAFLVSEGRRVILDAEHFFDGYRFDPDYAVKALLAGQAGGASALVLCDTNGGMLPDDVAGIVTSVKSHTEAPLGMHAHNDSGCAVANTMAAVAAGATHVQGCVNGYGERTGNADLVAVAANLEIKRGAIALKGDGLAESTRISHAISEITNIAPYPRQPYVGASAFAHKAGLHASAIKIDPDLYQHTDPSHVGNDMRMLVSEMAGRASIELKGKELGFDLSGQSELLGRVTDRVKAAEAAGYTFDAADASFELLLRHELGESPRFWDVETWAVHVASAPGDPREADAEAVVKLRAGEGRRLLTVGEGNGPVNALDHALRQALVSVYPEIARFELIDFKVRIMDACHGTDAVTRVLITTVDTDSGYTWRTVGVGPNVIEASWEALTEALFYGLLKAGVAPNP